jgi:NitT/TauT family transport system permease protein
MVERASAIGSPVAARPVREKPAAAPRAGIVPVLRAGIVPVLRIGVPVALLAVWEIAIRTGLIPVRFFPAPSSLITEIWADVLSGKLLVDTVSSLYRLFWGLAIGIVLGVGIGMAMGLSRLADAAFGVTVQVLRAIPPITWIGFSILWFGLGNRPAIFLIVLGTVFPMLLNTYAGVKQVDMIYLRAARNLGAHGLLLFRDVVLAAAMPSILTGLRVSLGLAWILMVVGELIAVPAGLGDTLMRAQDYGQTARMLAYMLLIGFYGYLSDLVLVAITRRVLRWQRTIEG